MATFGMSLLRLLAVVNFALGDVPACRKSPEMGSLLGGRELAIYGGKGYKLAAAGLMLGDTWRIDLEKGGSSQWQELSTPSPAARWKTSTTPVLGGKAWALFGGCTGVYADKVQNDLWVFSTTTNSWRLVLTENPPPPRRGHVTASNATHLIVFGGKSWHPSDKKWGTTTVLKDLWALPLSALDEGALPGRWTQGASLPAAARWGATGTVLIGSSGQEVFVLYGGRVKVGKKYVYFETLHVYDFLSDSWSEVEPLGQTPGARDHHAATALNGDLWIFGGRTEPKRKFKADVADLWSYNIDENRWTQHTWKGRGPSRRFMPSISALQYKGHAAIAMFGGEHFDKRHQKALFEKKWVLYNDLWAFDTVEERWIEIYSSNCPGVPEKAELLAEDLDEDDEIENDFDGESGERDVSLFQIGLCLGLGAIVLVGVFFVKLRNLNLVSSNGMDYQYMPVS